MLDARIRCALNRLRVFVAWTCLVILASPAVASAYVDPTGGGFLLQLLLGGLAGLLLVLRLYLRQMVSKLQAFVRRILGKGDSPPPSS